MAATVTIASGATWQEVAADRQKHRGATIAALEPALPEIKEIPQYTIPLAKEYLTAEEVAITETLVEKLVPQLAKGELSSTAVTKAFLRRAGLAQKAVRPLFHCLSSRLTSAGQLHHRTPPNSSPRTRRVPRYLPQRQWQACWTITWYTDQCQGAHWDERAGSECWVRCLGWQTGRRGKSYLADIMESWSGFLRKDDAAADFDAFGDE